MRIVALAGGVGGAKLADGLAQCLSPEDLTIVVNTGDDFELYGLKICPDLDTVCYTLAGIADPQKGWGRDDESWNVLNCIKSFGEDAWFQLGDKDLALHLIRTLRIYEGKTLTSATKEICHMLRIPQNVYPMCDQVVSTMVNTSEKGWISFQEYFVRNKCEPKVLGFDFMGAKESCINAELEIIISLADAVIICPSNPWVSIDPILSVPNIKTLISDKKVVVVSPIIAGKTIKGPAAKMFQELGITPSVLSVADHYRTFLHAIVLDQNDAKYADELRRSGIIPLITDTVMVNSIIRKQLAGKILEYLLH